MSVELIKKCFTDQLKFDDIDFQNHEVVDAIFDVLQKHKFSDLSLTQQHIYKTIIMIKQDYNRQISTVKFSICIKFKADEEQLSAYYDDGFGDTENITAKTFLNSLFSFCPRLRYHKCSHMFEPICEIILTELKKYPKPDVMYLRHISKIEFYNIISRRYNIADIYNNILDLSLIIDGSDLKKLRLFFGMFISEILALEISGKDFSSLFKLSKYMKNDEFEFGGFEESSETEKYAKILIKLITHKLPKYLHRDDLKKILEH